MRKLISGVALGVLLITVLWVVRDEQGLSLLSREKAQLKANLAQAQTQLIQTQSQLTDASAQNSNLQLQLQTSQDQLKTAQAHPRLLLWNSCGGPCTMAPGLDRAGGVPDTFTYSVSFTSTVPVSVHFVTLDGYYQYAHCNYSLACVNSAKRGGDIPPSTEVTDYEFHLAEGCASYIAIYQSTRGGEIQPEIYVTYNPANTPTGACG